MVAKKLIQRCREEYNYDMVAMIRDQRSGKAAFGAAPIRFIYRNIHQNK